MSYHVNCINSDSKLVHLTDAKDVHAATGDLDTWEEQDEDFKQSFVDKAMSMLSKMTNAYLLLDGCTEEMINSMVKISKIGIILFKIGVLYTSSQTFMKLLKKIKVSYTFIA